MYIADLIQERLTAKAKREGGDFILIEIFHVLLLVLTSFKQFGNAMSIVCLPKITFKLTNNQQLALI